jgi:hypothetical protein
MYNLVDDAWGKFVVNPEKITVPFLVMAGENELNGEGIRQAHEFYDKLGNSVKEKSDHHHKRMRRSPLPAQ